MALGSPIARDVSSSNVLAVDTPFACRSEYPTHFCEAHFLLVHLMVGGRYQLRARAVTQACRKHTKHWQRSRPANATPRCFRICGCPAWMDWKYCGACVSFLRIRCASSSPPTPTCARRSTLSMKETSSGFSKNQLPMRLCPKSSPARWRNTDWLHQRKTFCSEHCTAASKC